MARPRSPRHPESKVVFDGTYGPPGRKTREGWAGQRHRILHPGGLRGNSSLRL